MRAFLGLVFAAAVLIAAPRRSPRRGRPGGPEVRATGGAGHAEDGGVRRARRRRGHREGRPRDRARIRRHEPRQPAADHAGHDLRAGVDFQDRDDHGHHAAGRTGQDRSGRAGAAVPARLQSPGRGRHARRRDLASPDAHAWLGGPAHSRRPRHRHAGAFRRDDAGPAATGGARRSLELQQRGVHRGRPRDRSRHRSVDPRRASRAGLSADRPDARVHAARGRRELSVFRRASRRRRVVVR